ncbi:hypothetical protein [Bosea thiooxidans]|uniref:hypothetical protein n=1 Tax=Bosea thiooxidans TaxID=53254 RepID=UPI000B1531A6|nr:hypothetical protein [Bosea thiooxidans]
MPELRVHVAEAYVSTSGLREQVGQVMDLPRDVQNDVGIIKKRLDRVIEVVTRRSAQGAVQANLKARQHPGPFVCQ